MDRIYGIWVKPVRVLGLGSWYVTHLKLIELEMTLDPRYFIPGDLCLQFSLLRNLLVNTLAEDSS